MPDDAVQQNGERTLLIDDGGPAALVATLLEPAPSRVTLWFRREAGPAPNRRRAASDRRVAVLGLAGLEAAGPVDVSDDERTAGLASARLLLEAATAAVRLGCSRVVWPVSLGEDLLAMASAADRVRTIERLLDLETDVDSAPVRFDLPLLDLTLHQVADLAIDLDAPAEAAWWCEHDGAGPCAACPACERWQQALQRARFAFAGEGEGA